MALSFMKKAPTSTNISIIKGVEAIFPTLSEGVASRENMWMSWTQPAVKDSANIKAAVEAAKQAQAKAKDVEVSPF